MLGVLKLRILLFRVLYWGPLFSETPTWGSYKGLNYSQQGYFKGSLRSFQGLRVPASGPG